MGMADLGMVSHVVSGPFYPHYAGLNAQEAMLLPLLLWHSK